MSKFIVSANGNCLGEYDADDAQGARDACAVDAGYRSEADMVDQLEQPSELVVDDSADWFLDSADSRETSKELMQAILKTAGGSGLEAARVWADPTDAEMVSIYEIVTGNGLHPATDYAWGDAGYNWNPTTVAD